VLTIFSRKASGKSGGPGAGAGCAWRTGAAGSC